MSFDRTPNNVNGGMLDSRRRVGAEFYERDFSPTVEKESLRVMVNAAMDESGVRDRKRGRVETS